MNTPQEFALGSLASQLNLSRGDMSPACAILNQPNTYETLLQIQVRRETELCPCLHNKPYSVNDW